MLRPLFGSDIHRKHVQGIKAKARDLSAGICRRLCFSSYLFAVRQARQQVKADVFSFVFPSFSGCWAIEGSFAKCLACLASFWVSGRKGSWLWSGSKAGITAKFDHPKSVLGCPKGLLEPLSSGSLELDLPGSSSGLLFQSF